ncbi:Ankyrin repeat [Macleaya cordata]|uniref:Ankyrin repeat n=1 Tax=Macleaya cordata TaxID=56857 RepID=A0A200R4C9_MACCD|nr:Ankyrin repeat [Macleaya cordata]
MPPSYFPLRWESTGDQWWYASPIDWAAANGHYDLVRELLHLDTNLLIKLTSLRRIRRLETVWDDEAQFDDVAKCRSQVARKLLHECENKRRTNSLIRAGYGGWLLYTAASAGDMGFVQELLERDPLLVFGEGEFGVTDIFYAAARSKNSAVFKLLFDFSVSPRCLVSSRGELEEQQPGEIPSVFKWEMRNRAVHAAARGGNPEVLKDLLGDCSDVLCYRDVQGSTILHAASGRGQVEVVKDLVASFDIITSVDNQGNTALHVAAYRGHLAVVEALIISSPLSTSLTNNSGDTFLHMAVAGFRTPGFRRLDRQIELMKQLVFGKIVNMQDVINIRNNEGRTALHTAVIGNIHGNLVELLMTVPSIDLNIRDIDGMTPLDLLRQRPRSASSEILIKQLISAGGISNCQDYMARSALVSHLKMQGIGSSPGTSFRIPDAEIFLYTGVEISDAGGDQVSARPSSCSSELSQYDENRSSVDNKKRGSINNAARRLKILLRWPRRMEKKTDGIKKLGDDDSVGSCKKWSDSEETPTPLRQRFSKNSSLPTNKRTLSVRGNFPSPSTKKKFAAGLMHGVIQAMPHLSAPSGSPSSSFSRSSMSSPTSLDKQKGVYVGNECAGPSCSSPSINGGTQETTRKSTSINKKLMNQYFCFGAQGLAVDEPVSRPQTSQGYKRSVLSIA